MYNPVMPFGKVRIHELDELRPPMALSGDKIPDKVLGARWYTPDGEPIPSDTNEDILSATQKIWNEYKPANRLRSPNFYRSGEQIYVSTVYLGLDHGWITPFPVIWETMVFTTDTWDGEYCWRYCTRNAAYNGHRMVVQAIRNSQRARREAWDMRGGRVAGQRKKQIDRIAKAYGVPRKLVTV